MTEPEHRPEFAIPLTQPLWIEGSVSTGGEEKAISGYAVAVGWDRPQATTFYLVSDVSVARPVWIAEDEVTGNSIRPS